MGGYMFLQRNYDAFYKLAVSFIGFFIVLVIGDRKCHFEFDAAKGKLFWSRKGLFSKKGWGVPLAEIADVIIKSDNNPDGPSGYLIFVITNKGKMPLNIYGTNEEQIRITYSPLDKEEAERIANLIRQHLGQESLDMVHDGVSELAAAGDYMGAVKLAEEEGLNLISAVQRVRQMKSSIEH